MSSPLRITVLVLLLLPFLPACSTPPLHIQSDVVPAESLRVAQLMYIFPREEILKAEAYKTIIAAGVSDSDLTDGSVLMARVYCCGGMTQELSSEFVYRVMLYVPKDLKVSLGDFVEARVGRPSEHGDKGRIHTVTRIVAKYEDKQESCWWDPKNDKLWLRIPYCEWMEKDGWVKQGGLYPAWYKPAQ